LHPGIEKMVRLFKETYYYPDYQNLIQNLIKECNDCNQAKTEHTKTSLLLKTTPETEFCREINVADIYTIKNQNYLTSIDLYSKFGSAVELNEKDWMEVKRGLFRIFNSMGKPRTLKQIGIVLL